jgi:hypothetical protein
MTKSNTSHSCKDEIETEDKWGEKAQSLLFRAEMHNLQTPAPLKSPLCKCNNVLMQYEVKRVNFEDRKRNIAEARTNHPQLAHGTEFAPQTSSKKHSPAYNNIPVSS